jgi:hypothetical protein
LYRSILGLPEEEVQQQESVVGETIATEEKVISAK